MTSVDVKRDGKFVLDEIKEILLQQYSITHEGKEDAKLLVKRSENCIFLELDGHPPKGYGIWIPENKRLNLYDATGNRFKEYYVGKGILDFL